MFDRDAKFVDVLRLLADVPLHPDDQWTTLDRVRVDMVAHQEYELARACVDERQRRKEAMR